MRIWDFRPSALALNYGSAVMSSLFDNYLSDGFNASKNGWSLPKRKRSSVRTCQWNIHYLQPNLMSGRRSATRQAHYISAEVLNTDADIIILNEVGIMGHRDNCFELDILCNRLEEKGYTIQIAGGSYPTAVASRLPIKRKSWFQLDYLRSSVYMEVEVGSINKTSADDDGQDEKTVKIFGTHLDHISGTSRLQECKKLLAEFQSLGCDNNDRIMIIGDLNQQRSCDYLEKEWEAICENMDHRNAPHDDGVSTELQNAGFKCCYDQINEISCNWNPGDPPPATHWSSTVVDYAYSRGNINCESVYISPSNLSDHRMIVVDWKIE
mmetsp:Transcript_36753/g.48677  ORF Transcript_36753/g.48677 Transcript_36753/m.48677 type:complete len:324 (+) Transcript_36753:104-1075(+)